MAVKLETLELEIVQSIKSSRSKALDSLEKRLRGLRDALVGFQDADEAVHIIQRISNVTHTLGTAVDSTSKMASALRRLNNATTDMSSAGQNVRSISAAFRDLSNASNFIDGESLQRIVDATGQMSASGRNLGAFSRGLNSVGKDADAIGQTVERFQTFVNTLSETGDAINPEPLEKIAGVSQTIGTAGNSLNRFARGINALGTSMLEVEVTANRFEKFIYGINDASKAVDTAALAPITEFAKTVGSAGSRLEKFATALEKLSKFGANSEQLKQALQGIDAIVGRLAQHKAELDALAETLNNVSASLKTLNRAGDVGAQIQRVQKSLKTAGSDAAAFARHLVKIPWEHLKNKIGGLVQPLQNLVHSFARIAMYRALRTAVKAITQGFGEGIKHLYHWSELVNNEFKASMDSLSTSAHYLRDSLGAMVSPLIDALAPAVEILVEKFVSLLNIINQFFATLTGKDTWRRAVRTATEYDDGIKDAADSTKEATDAQKKLNKALQDFDELNLITTSTTNGRNPSGGNNGNDSGIDSTHFVEEPVADWIKGIKDAIERGEWYEAGNMLADKLNSLIDSFDAEEFGKNVGQKIQHGIEFYLGFMKNTHWDTLGGKLADFLNAIVKEVDPQDLGEAIVAKFNAAIDFLAGFTKKFDWEEAGKWLADVIIGAFTGLNWGTLGTLIGDLAGGLLKMIKAGFKELLNNGDKVMDSIGDFFSGLGWDGLKNVVELGMIVGGFKILFAAIFGDAGLIASVKSSVAGLLSQSGLGSGASYAITVMLALELTREMSGWLEKVKEKGFTSGTLEYFGADSEFTLIGWLTPTHEIATGLEAIRTELQKLFMEDPSNLPFFKKTLGLVNAWLRLLGMSELDFTEDTDKPGYDKPSVSSSTPGAQWDPIGQEWFVPQLDTTAQTAALQAVQEAAKGARKGIQELPPTDDEVTAFKGQIDKERSKLNGSKGSIKSAASSAHSGINAIKPADSETTKFVNALKPWKKKLDGKGKNDGSLVQGANNAKSALDTVSKGTYNPVVKVTTSGLGDIEERIKAAAKNRTIKLTIDPYVLTSSTNKSGKTVETRLNSQQFNKVFMAEGGWPGQGSFFVAGEVPGQAEMVGNINGKTGVASGKEITGIADAVRDTGQTEAELLRQQNQLLRQILAKSGNVTLAPTAAAGRWVAQSQQAYARATGG